MAPRLMVLAVLAACAVASAGGLAVGQTSESCEIRTGYTGYGVYNYRLEDGSVAGADVDLIRALAEDLGCESSFHLLPWARVLLEIENGKLDATSSASRTAERLEYAHFSIPYRQAQMAIFVRKGESGNFAIERLADVPRSGLRLGIVSGYYYGADFDALMQDPDFAARIDGAVDYETNIRKLMLGRIDGYLVDDVGVMIAEIEDRGVAEEVEQHPVFLPGDEFHLMFSRKSVSADMMADIDAALTRMKADGRLQAIMDSYLK